jgi:hypothetical protein
MTGAFPHPNGLCPRWVAPLVVLFLACAPGPTRAEAVAEQSPRFEAVLKPLVGEGGEVAAIQVDALLHGGLQSDAGRLRLTAPIVYAGARGIADRVRDLKASDVTGELPLAPSDDPETPGGFPYFRHWEAQREAVFPVRFSYRTAVALPGEHRGPPFNIHPSAGGVSGGGSGFLVVPENADSSLSRVRWDLREFSNGALGVSSFGDGDFELPGPPNALWQGWYMAGPVGRFPLTGDLGGFSASWLGEFSFDPMAEMARAGDIYAWLGTFFEYLDPPPRYRVFMRIIDSDQTRFSGTALTGSFMLSGGPDSGRETGGEAPRGTFFHEMIHMWVGFVEGPMGVTSWFSEGLTTYYSLLLPYRGGYETLDELNRGINRLAASYFENPARLMSAVEIVQVGFGDEDIRHMPYQRGALYFADLDARIRAKSAGSRSLDSLMKEIFRKRESEQGFTFDHQAWIDRVTAELGDEAGTEFTERILEGNPFIPASDAFGPCFTSRPQEYEAETGTVAGVAWIRNPAVSEDQCRRN